MCGVIGILETKGQPASMEQLKRMVHTLDHRGPDGSGYHLDREFGAGHTRLSIIDLSDYGAQPMLDPTRRYVLTFNGEIYNYKELKDDLIQLGHVFTGSSDSEVLLHAFMQWGDECLEKLNGMFAFLIWDKQTRELFVARDRYGIKPLYYVNINGQFNFASEIKAFSQTPHFVRSVDSEGLFEYMSFQNYLTDRTIFKGVKTFPAGHFARISTEKPNLFLKQYWDFNFSNSPLEKTEDQYLEELGHLLDQAVKRQLVADVEVGAYLSGGTDSTCITALASRHLPYIKTYTVGFDLTGVTDFEQAFDERKIAERIAYLFKTEQYEMVLKSGDMERSLAKIVHHLEEPRVGQCYPNYYASKLASRFTKVVLSGVGGDEIFAGYPWRYFRHEGHLDFNSFTEQYYKQWQRLVPEEQKESFMAPIWSEVKHLDTLEIFRSVFKDRTMILKKPEDYINQSLYFEAKTFLHGLLTVEDKLSMAYSMESRVPMLDNDLVDFVEKLPLSLKLNNLGPIERINENVGDKVKVFYKRTKDGKVLFRNFLSQILPDVSELNKQGFSAPDATWFRNNSKHYTSEKLFGKNSFLYDYFDQKQVTEIIDSHFSGKQNCRLLIWSLLYLNEVFRSN